MQIQRQRIRRAASAGFGLAGLALLACAVLWPIQAARLFHSPLIAALLGASRGQNKVSPQRSENQQCKSTVETTSSKAVRDLCSDPAIVLTSRRFAFAIELPAVVVETCRRGGLSF